MKQSPQTDRICDVLVVTCACEMSEQMVRASESHVVVPNAGVADTLLETGTFDCVVAIVDPSRRASVTQFNQVTHAAARCDALLVTTATFNPSWIENLMKQFGVAAHFRDFPNRAQLDDLRRERRSGPSPRLAEETE